MIDPQVFVLLIKTTPRRLAVDSQKRGDDTGHSRSWRNIVGHLIVPLSLLQRCHLVLALVVAIGASGSFAACHEPRLTPPEAVRIDSSSVLIVTHASALYDSRYAIKHGLDQAVMWAKERRIPVVYLVDESPIRYYEMEDCSPDYWVRSIDGEVPFDVNARTVYFAGGHLEHCLNRTANEVLFRQMAQRPSRTQYVFLMDAIYSNGKSVEESDPYYKDFSIFAGVISYGRPGGEAAPRVSLLEIAGAIKSIRHQVDYFRKILPRWDRSTPADYEINLTIKDLQSEILRKGKSFGGPKLEFIFVESADSL